jgi:hypothetical protein
LTLPNEYRWEDLLDVVNCSRSMRRISKGVYTCPVSGGAYSHRRAKYFGAYDDKAVRWLFEIKAVLVVERGCSAASVNWKNINNGDDDLIEEAIQKIRSDDHLSVVIQEHGRQVFLLTSPARTNFYKSTPGGMLGSKQYFPGIAADCKDSADLAEKLKNKRWSDFEPS